MHIYKKIDSKLKTQFKHNFCLNRKNRYKPNMNDITFGCKNKILLS